jgi:DNA topoisomerase 2-associated protein PAT1
MHEPLTNRQALIILEELYDILLEVEQMRRDQPDDDAEDEVFLEWSVLPLSRWVYIYIYI